MIISCLLDGVCLIDKEVSNIDVWPIHETGHFTMRHAAGGRVRGNIV